MEDNVEFLFLLLIISVFIICSSILIILYFLKQRLLLKKMRRMYLDLGEEEREKLSFELHDQVALSTVKLEALVSQVDLDFEQKSSLRDAIAELKFNISRINDGIYPAAIEDIKYENLIRELLNFFATTEITLHYQSIRIDALSKILKVHLYRIIQEILINAVRHSQAKFIELIFNDLEGSGVEIEILYNGEIHESASRKGSRGKRILKERLYRLGGSISINAEDGLIIETIRVYGN